MKKQSYSSLEEDLLTPLDENLWKKNKKEEPDLDDILETPIIPGTSGVDC